jgi:hypothetical protein
MFGIEEGLIPGDLTGQTQLAVYPVNLLRMNIPLLLMGNADPP